MKTIAFFNVKGGVGKTTSAVNIAHLAAQHKLHTLLWDLDPQSCASWYMGKDNANTNNVLKTFKGKIPLGEYRIKTPYKKLEMIPADLSLRKLEPLLCNEEYSKNLLHELAENLGEKNQLLIFDCAPAFSQVTESIFNCCDALVIPLIPSPLSLRAYQQLEAFIRSKKKWRHIQLQPFFNMVDQRRKIHKDVLINAKDLINDAEPITIPNSSDVERMGTEQKPLTDFAHSGPAAKGYQALWKRLDEKLQLS